MRDVLYLAIACVGWAICLTKTGGWLRDRGNADLGLVAVMSGAIASVMMWSSPALYIWLDQRLRVPNLGIAVIYSSVIVFVAGAQALLRNWTARGDDAARLRARRRTRINVVTLTVLWAVALVGFAVGRPDAVEHPKDFSTVYTGRAGVMVFLLVYIALFGWCMTSLGLLCRRYAAPLRTKRPWTARGLGLVTLGSYAILLYCLAKLATLIGSWAGANMDVLGDSVAPLCASVGALLVVAGFAVPSAGARWSARRRVRQLTPLWRTAVAAAPDVEMEDRARYVRVSAELKATRQMTEIRDAQLMLRAYVDRDLIEAALQLAQGDGLDADETAALVEAAALQRGLANRSAGRPAAEPAVTIVTVGQGDLAREHAHLVRVAQALDGERADRVLAAAPTRQAG
ncbi:MAB_1171c family putative transporter [Streptacidiphilus fuscans]|uniref:DUF6545 domain-containing protein n=1 Tax=Streptacidiphilus fuscans TaxID=2789292 RepID=A0A931FF87_9ACTN|nr:MAB_1171c family putative transporter [Streptacidiphilus fuscans]MBF9072602.1 hypothetical protein [Streptacidiphilus fuscans]